MSSVDRKILARNEAWIRAWKLRMGWKLRKLLNWDSLYSHNWPSYGWCKQFRIQFLLLSTFN